MTVSTAAQPGLLTNKQKNMSSRNLQEENRLLFDQLQLVQEELERRHYQTLTQSAVVAEHAMSTTVIQLAPVDERLIDTYAENLRCQALLTAQSDVHALQSKYALAGQLGAILIDGSRSAGAMLSVPKRLHKAWRQNRQEAVPASLGGKTFDKVIEAFKEGGESAVESLLGRAAVSVTLQASAWTALARTQMAVAPELAATMARRAFGLEPKPFRQKWLAFRLHEAGSLLEAEALLTLLPADIKFSDSEARQADRLKIESKRSRFSLARDFYTHTEQQEKLQHQWQELAKSRDQLSTQLVQLQSQLALAQNEVAVLKTEQDTQSRLVTEFRTRCETLQAELLFANKERDQRSALLSQEQVRNKTLESSLRDLKQLHQEQEDLAAQWFEQGVSLQVGIAELTQQRDELAKLVSEQQEKCTALEAKLSADEETAQKQAVQMYEQYSALQATLHSTQQTYEIADALARERLEHGESLQAALVALEQEHDGLKQELLLENSALQARIAEMAQRSQELEVQVKQEQLKCDDLQQELRDLGRLRDQQAELAAQRQGELLQQARDHHSLEKSKMELEARQQELERLLAVHTARETEYMQNLRDQVQTLAAQQPTLEVKVADLLKQQAKSQAEELLRVHAEQMQSIKGQAQVLAAQQPALEAAVAALMKQQAEQQSKQQTDELLRVRRYLENLIKSNSANTTRQVQSFIGMQEYLATGSLPAFNSQSHSWPVSSDFALFLMQRVVLEQYDLIVEFGSGMSTVVLAKTLAIAVERTGRKPPRFVSFDHLERYYKQTKDHLDQAGLGDSVDLVLAPLAEWKGEDGATQDYYDCRKKLSDLARSRSPVFKRILVIVDGPPASTGTQARYPAGPIVADSFPKAHIDFVLDDYIREDEKETAQRWLSELKLTEVPGALTEYKFEKDACLITVHPKDTK
nr:hypothetical protein [Alcaligenes faecalis]